MTKDKIIELARIAGVRDDENIFEFNQYKYLERFARLVAARERRECAKLAAEVGYWGLVHEIEARGEQA